MGSSAATQESEGAAELTEEEREVAQVLHLLPKLILHLERRRLPGIPLLLSWGQRRRRSLPPIDADGHRHPPPPPPPDPLQTLLPLEENEKGGAASKTSSPPSPFQFPGSGCEEDHDRRPAKLSKKLATSKKDYKERAEEHKSKIAALNDSRADLQRAIEEQKKLFQSLSENSFLLREAERVHMARSRDSMQSLVVASPVGAAVPGQIVGFSPSPMDPAHLYHKRPEEEEQTASGLLRNARDEVIPESACLVPPAATAARRGFLIDLNVAAEEMAELEASTKPSLPLLPQQQSPVPPAPQPPQQTLLPPPPPPMPSEWNHHHHQKLLQLRQEKAAKTAESRRRRREIQREKRASIASAAPPLLR